MRRPSPTLPTTSWYWTVIVGLGIALVALLAVAPDLPFRSADSGWYFQMATGHSAEVPAPFRSRILHTGLAAALHRGFGLRVETGFLLVAALAMACCVGCVTRLVRGAGPAPITAVVLTGSWLAVVTLRDATLPDALNAGLIALTLAVAARNLWLALPVLLTAIVGRETTAVLAAVLAVRAWRSAHRRLAFAVFGTALAGFALVRAVAPATNVHALGSLTYLLTKAPFNLARNVLGLEFWINTIPYCEPVWVRELPSFLHWGAVERFGFCGFNAVRPLTLLASWFGIFGVVPGWLAGRRRHVAESWSQSPLWVQTGLIYGVVMFTLAPAAGTALPRLIGYGWPAFWLAGPLLAGPLPVGGRRRLRLALLQVSAAVGLPAVVATFPLSTSVLAGVVLVGTAANLAALRLARSA